MNKLSFPRTYRLLHKTEFDSVFGQSQRISHKHLLVLYKDNDKTHARLGLIVGKRVANLAVTRNRIKRILRESFRAHQIQLKGLDVVVIARQHCDSLNKIQLRENVDNLWQKLSCASKTPG